MLRDLLWLWEGRMQYERQKAQGLAGLVALLTVILVIWKWNDWFYPLAKKFGIIDFLKRTGLWHENEVMTIINVIAVIFLFSLFIGLIAFGSIFLLGLIGMIFSSKVGQILIVIGLLPFYPLIYLSVRKNRYDVQYKKDKEKREILLQYKDLPENQRKFHMFLHQLEEQDPSFTYEKLTLTPDEARVRLNKVLKSLQEKTDWLIGYDKYDDKFYLLFPNPLPMGYSNSFNDYYYSVDDFYIDGQILDSENKIKNEDFYVPCMEIKIDWDWQKKQFVMDVDNEVGEINTSIAFGTFQGVYYKLEGNDINKFYNTILNKLNVIRVLERTHIVYYTMQILLKSRAIKEFYGRVLEEFRNIPNAEKYASVYEEKVLEDIERRARYGAEWAKAYLKEVKNA